MAPKRRAGGNAAVRVRRADARCVGCWCWCWLGVARYLTYLGRYLGSVSLRSDT